MPNKWDREAQFRKAPVKRYGPQPPAKFDPPPWLLLLTGGAAGWIVAMIACLGR